jgi:hypothetical protein
LKYKNNLPNNEEQNIVFDSEIDEETYRDLTIVDNSNAIDIEAVETPKESVEDDAIFVNKGEQDN